jgi:hypothetical protein
MPFVNTKPTVLALVARSSYGPTQRSPMNFDWTVGRYGDIADKEEDG